jgi:hypothetical protein
MTIQGLLSKAFRLLAVSAIAITPALAEVIVYNTTGVFSTTGTNVLTGNNGLSITYGNTVGNMVTNPFPTNAAFGTMTTVGPTMGTDSVTSMFTLTIMQTAPTSETETLTDTISGTIEQTSSAEILKFTGGFGDGGTPVLTTNPITGAPSLSFMLGDTIYFVDQITPINPSTTNGGVTTVRGAITEAMTVIPEPSSMMLLGGGLLGAAGVLRRKLRQ